MNDYRDELQELDSIATSDNLDVPEENIYKTKLNEEKTLRRAAIDQYESEEAAIRELLANGATAIKDAKDEGYLKSDEGQITITLEEIERNEWRLIIKDNGIGFSEERLEILSEIGVSTGVGNINRTAKHGMGFYSIFLLVEEEDLVLFLSKSRETNRVAKHIRKLGQAREITEENLQIDYGTELQIQLKNNIDISELKKWITRQSKAVREPVKFKYITQNNSEITTYPSQNIADHYESEYPNSFIYESEYFSAAAHPQIDPKQYFMDIRMKPIELPIPINLAVRYHTSEKTIVKTDSDSVLESTNRDKNSKLGTQVLPQSKYNKIDTEKQYRYTSFDSLSESAVYTPKTSGTRDSIVDEDTFITWIENLILEDLDSYLTKLFSSNVDKLTKNEIMYISALFSNSLKDDLTRLIRKYTSHRNNIILNTDDNLTLKYIQELTDYTISIEKSTVDSFDSNGLAINTPIQSKRVNSSRKYKPSELTAYANKNNIPIYMCVSVNQKKYDVLKTIYSNVILVKVSESDEYDMYEKLGWNKLKNITKTSLESFDLSEEKQKKCQSILNTSPESNSNEITLRFGSSQYNNMTSIEVPQLQKQIQSNQKIGEHKCKQLILFPESSDHNISNHYDIAGPFTAIAKCSDSVADTLQYKLDNVKTYEEYYAQASEKYITTPSKQIKVDEISPSSCNTIYIVFIDETQRDFIEKQDGVDKSTIPKILENQYCLRKSNSNDLIILSSLEEEREFRPYFERHLWDLCTVVYPESLDPVSSFATTKLPEIETTREYNSNKFLAIAKIISENFSKDVEELLIEYCYSQNPDLSSNTEQFAFELMIEGARSRQYV